MSIVHDFDTEKYYLGTLCRREHDYSGTGRSLRYLSRCSNCIECQKLITDKRPKKSIPLMAVPLDSGFDADKFYLGKLCPMGHEFQDTGRSVRYAGKCGSCRECSLTKSKKSSARNAKLPRIDLLISSALSNGISIDFDTEKFRLGRICKYGHDYKNSGI